MPQLQARTGEEPPPQQVPGPGENPTVQRERCKSRRLDARAQSHRCRTGLLVREISNIPWNQNTNPPGTTASSIQPNQGGSGQSGRDQLGGVPTWQSLCKNSRNPGDPLQIVRLPYDRGRLDEALHREAAADISLAVAVSQFYPARQNEGLSTTTTT